MILVSFKDMKVGMSWNCSRGGGSDWILGKGCLVGLQALEWASQGSGYSPELLEFKECWDSALRHGLNFGWSCVELRVGLGDLCGSLPTWDVL